MRAIVRNITLGIMLWLPCLAVAANNCRVIEFLDHVEAVCTGDPGFVPERTEPAAAAQLNPRGAQVSRTRQRLEEVRSMNAHRIEAPAKQATPVTVTDSETRDDSKESR